jgi:hypothetical protein
LSCRSSAILLSEPWRSLRVCLNVRINSGYIET